MNILKKAYNFICKSEEFICGAILCFIVALAFVTALGRCINHPISWTNDISQFCLAWLAFLGGDMALRKGRVMGVDILTRRMPERVQIIIHFVTNLLLIATLIIFMKYGYDLCISNMQRSYQALGISYSWATASLPICSVLMTITLVLESINLAKSLTNTQQKPAKEGS